MNLGKFKITNKGLYWGLIGTFAVLYLCVGFVSTLHSITFFHLANSLGLAILLGLTYEVGQASVLFSILMTKNKDRFLPWALMILLTALQVTANVYASFKFMVISGSNDWQYWQKSILFGVQASSPEMYQVIISWISGALLPVVALGMTALVAENMKMMDEENKENVTDDTSKHKTETSSLDEAQAEIKENHEIKDENSSVNNAENLIKEDDEIEFLQAKLKDAYDRLSRENTNSQYSTLHPKTSTETIQEPIIIDTTTFKDGIQPGHPNVNYGIDAMNELTDAANIAMSESKIEEPKIDNSIDLQDTMKVTNDAIDNLETSKVSELKVHSETKNENETLNKKPLKPSRGWHLKKSFIDSNGDEYCFGKFVEKTKDSGLVTSQPEPEAPKKA